MGDGLPRANGPVKQDATKVGREALGADGHLAVPRGLFRVIRRDPEHLAERLILYAVGALGEESRQWAERRRLERPKASTLDGVAEVRLKSARVARVDGAIAGCPLYIALVPAYIAVLYQQVRMVGRIAALEGRDPRDPGMAAEVLAMRDVYPTPQAAAAALEKLPPELPERSGRSSWRTRLRTWVELVRRVLVLVGLLSPPKQGPRASVWKRIANAVIGGAIWISTWVIPGAFMVVMSWACESSTRSLGARAQEFYGRSEAAERQQERPGRWRVRPDEGSLLRKLVRIVLLALAIGIPIWLLFAASVEQHQGNRNIWLAVLGTITALALVAGLVVSSRR
jgi:hypothetical protein